MQRIRTLYNIFALFDRRTERSEDGPRSARVSRRTTTNMCWENEVVAALAPWRGENTPHDYR